MIILPEDPNLIYVETIRYGCLKKGFDSTYPNRLNGMISPEEFNESIHNINRHFSIKSQIFCIAIYILCMLGGLTLMIISWTIASRTSHPIFLGIGIAILPSSSILFAIGWKRIYNRGILKLRQAIEIESQKYYGKSPTAGGWWLDFKTEYIPKHGGRRRSMRAYHLVIAIHNRILPGKSAHLHTNQTALWSMSSARQETPPPPYPGYPMVVCSQCGQLTHGSMANFCSSCGHRLH